MTDAMYHKPHPQIDEGKTVVLTERDIRAATRLLALLAASPPPTIEAMGGGVKAGVTIQDDRTQMLAVARRTFLERRRRAEHFGRAMFGEPAWDMLLALYIMETSSARNTVGRLLTFSGAPQTTALRWLDYLEKQHLVSREAHPTDRRTAFIEITEKARDALDAYFSGTLMAGG